VVKLLSPMKNNAGSLLEIIWFVLGGLMFFMGIDIASSHGFSQAWYYFVLAVLAFVMYAFRRKARMTKK